MSDADSVASGGDRGASDVVAIAILVGMVVTGAVLVAAAGGSVIQDTRDRSASTTAVAALQSVDAQLTTLAHGGTGDRARLAVGTDDPGRFHVDRSGSIDISIDGGACNATLPLTSIEYETRGGTTLAYEAGGIWRTDAGGTTAIQAPDLGYSNRTIRLSVQNLSGRIDDEAVSARVLPSSLSATRAVERELFARHACARPDVVTIEVRSDRYRAWGRYLAEEFDLAVGRGVRVDPTDRTATVTIPQRMLPRAADDDRNRVVDFRDGRGTADAGGVAVEKGSPSLTYPVSITVLGGTTQGGRPTETVSRDRRPLDVLLVLDESHSMSGEKLADTRAAATGFVGDLDTDAGDRVGVVGYSDVGFCAYLPRLCPSGYAEDARVHAGLDDDTDEVVERIEEGLWAQGGTPMAAGINRTIAHAAAEERDDARTVVVLLSDGRHNGAGNVTAAAERAAARGVTIYTVGFGDDADEETLASVANATGGRYYHAADAAALRERFADIAVEVTTTRSIRPTPVTARAGSATLRPDGSLDAVEPNGTAHDLKDPAVRPPIESSLDLEDGRTLSLSLTYWDCERWATTNETVEDPEGRPFRLARCVATDGPNGTIDGAGGDPRVRVFTAANTTADLPDATGSWVESNVTALLRGAGYVASDGSLDLDSDQVVFGYDLPDGEADFNDLVVVVEVGYGDHEVSVRHAVSVTVRDVRLGP